MNETNLLETELQNTRTLCHLTAAKAGEGDVASAEALPILRAKVVSQEAALRASYALQRTSEAQREAEHIAGVNENRRLLITATLEAVEESVRLAAEMDTALTHILQIWAAYNAEIDDAIGFLALPVKYNVTRGYGHRSDLAADALRKLGAEPVLEALRRGLSDAGLIPGRPGAPSMPSTTAIREAAMIVAKKVQPLLPDFLAEPVEAQVADDQGAVASEEANGMVNKVVGHPMQAMADSEGDDDD